MNEALLKKVNILLQNAAKTEIEHNYYRGTKPTGTYSDITQDYYVVDDSDDWKLDNKHADLLIKLHSQLQGDSLRDFEKLLFEKTMNGNNDSERIVSAITLVHIGKQENLVDLLILEFKSDADEDLTYVMLALSEILAYQYHLLSSDTIERLYDWSTEYFEGANDLGKSRDQNELRYMNIDDIFKSIQNKANEALMKDFTLQIEAGYNPDISVDEVKVKTAIEQLGLPMDLTESLEHIDTLVNLANTPSKYRDAMSAIRAFNERLTEKIAHNLDENSKINGKDSKEAVIEFKAKRLISHDVGEMLISFRHFLSNDGTHRLKSKQEDARIAKSLNIELSLYLLRRLEEVLKIKE